MNDNRKKIQTNVANGKMKHDNNMLHRNKYNVTKNEKTFLPMNKGVVGYKKDSHINRYNHSSNMNPKFTNYGNKTFSAGPSSPLGTSAKFSRQTNKLMNNNINNNNQNHNQSHKASNNNNNNNNNNNSEMSSFYSSKNTHMTKGSDHQYKKKIYHSKINDSGIFQNLKKTINKETNHQRVGIGTEAGTGVGGSGGGGIGKISNVINNSSNNLGNTYRQNPMGGYSANKGSVMHTSSGSNANYSLGLFIENPQNTFVFDIEDLKQLFSHYKGAKHIRILNNKAAAQVNFYDQSMIQQIKKDINGLTIDNVGTIRCIVLNNGKKIEQFLPFSSNDPIPSPNTINHPFSKETAIQMLKQITTLLNKSQKNRQIKGCNVTKKEEDAMTRDINNAKGNSIYNINSKHNIGTYGEMKQYVNNKNIEINKNCDIGNGNINFNTSKTSDNHIAFGNIHVGNIINKPYETNNVSYSHINNNNILQNKRITVETNELNEQKELDENQCVGKRLSRFELIDVFGHPAEFDVLSKIQGVNNANIKYIYDQTDNKLKFEIKGRADNDAPVVDRMHISITADEVSVYEKGIDLILKLLNNMFQEYCDICMKKGIPLPTSLGFKRHEYIYNYDGSTKYIGVKEKGHITKENYKTYCASMKNKNANTNINVNVNANTNGSNAMSNTNSEFNVM